MAVWPSALVGMCAQRAIALALVATAAIASEAGATGIFFNDGLSLGGRPGHTRTPLGAEGQEGCVMTRSTLGPVLAALLLLLSLGAGTAARAQGPQILLNSCVANPDRCALSIVHSSGGWESHYNADRPQVTASTFKIFVLLAYADAVSRGEIDPDRVVTLDEWGSLWAGFDLGSLRAAYDRLGAPSRVTLDELAGAMMRESDNAATDVLLDLLGARDAARLIKRWVPGFHDVPKPINVLFATWDNNPDEPFIGSRVINDYTGFENAGYQRELEAILAAMRDPLYVQQIRVARCEFPPWETPPPGCVRGVNAEAFIELGNRFFMRATTRSYAEAMKAVLEGDLFPRRMQEVVERHLEWWMGFAEISDRFGRYGAKAGGLVGGVRTWATFLDCRESGDRVAISIQLRRGLRGADHVRLFAEEVACNPGFAEQVRSTLPADPELPEISLRVLEATAHADGNGKSFDVRIDVLNTSPFPAHSRSELRLYASDDNVLDGGDVLLASARTPVLVPYGSRQVRLAASEAAAAELPFIIVVVDANDEVVEGDEDNNIVWERIGPDP